MDARTHDVVIVGGGIGGTTLAAVLARHGADVLIIEGAGHPRFAIGESTIPETTLLQRVIATRYDVPELAYLSTYGGTRRHITSACGVKRNFSFFRHDDGIDADPRESTQFSTFSPPLGPDCHLYRQDIDAWLFHLAVGYGATGLVNQTVTGVEFDQRSVCVRTASGTEHRARFVVDAGGIRAVLPRLLGLRTDKPAFETRSRSLFTHMVGVAPWEDVVGGKTRSRLPSPPSQGTLHHLFDGGWFWVIPFDNHPRSTNRLCSVGVSLSLDRYPADGTPPDVEFAQWVARFPSVARQLAGSRAVRPVVGSDRNQFASARCAGERWFVLPHASNFIDPLFSSGLSVTFWAVNALAGRLLTALREDDFAPERFAFVDEWVRRCFDYYDTLVSRSYLAFGDFELWNAWNRVWMLASLYGNNGLVQMLSHPGRDGWSDPAWDRLERAPYRGVQAIDNERCAALLTRSTAEVDGYAAGRQSTSAAAAAIYGHLAASGIVPGPLALLDPSKRAPAGVFTMLPMARLLLWGRRAPEPVRGKYFTSGIGLVGGLLLGTVGGEVARGLGDVGHVLRDTVRPWNRDWAGRPSATPLPGPEPVAASRELPPTPVP